MRISHLVPSPSKPSGDTGLQFKFPAYSFHQQPWSRCWLPWWVVVGLLETLTHSEGPGKVACEPCLCTGTERGQNRKPHLLTKASSSQSCQRTRALYGSAGTGKKGFDFCLSPNNELPVSSHVHVPVSKKPRPPCLCFAKF